MFGVLFDLIGFVFELACAMYMKFADVASSLREDWQFGLFLRDTEQPLLDVPAKLAILPIAGGALAGAYYLS